MAPDETRWIDGRCEQCGDETFEQTGPSALYCNGCRRRITGGERETPTGLGD